jgi:hypothetical protein
METLITENFLDDVLSSVLRKYPSLEILYFISWGEATSMVDFTIIHTDWRNLGKFTLILRLSKEEGVNISLVPCEGFSYERQRLGDLRSQLVRNNSLVLTSSISQEKIGEWLIKLFGLIYNHFQSLLGSYQMPRKSSELTLPTQSLLQPVRKFQQNYQTPQKLCHLAETNQPKGSFLIQEHVGLLGS